MAAVIRDALRPHQYPTAPTPDLLGCSGCAWTHPYANPAEPFTAHLAEVATVAVLEAVGRVLDEHRLTVSYTSQAASCTGCDWDDYDDAHGTYGDHFQALLAAALAGEG